MQTESSSTSYKLPVDDLGKNATHPLSKWLRSQRAPERNLLSATSKKSKNVFLGKARLDDAQKNELDAMGFYELFGEFMPEQMRQQLLGARAAGITSDSDSDSDGFPFIPQKEPPTV